MKTLVSIFSLLMLLQSLNAQDNPPRLIIRGDDIGSSHAANLGCIESYQKGIMKSVELMVPCAWFPEAVKMLNDNPGLDVGIHLVLTSEWENLKWRPVAHVPSLVDSNGYFFPMIWPNERFPAECCALRGADWKIEDIEKEFRAQIELAIAHVPHISHLTGHMGSYSWDEEVKAVYEKLAKEYNLDIAPADYGVKRARPEWNKEMTTEQRIDAFVDMLEGLEAGQTYLYVEHPAMDSPELQAHGHSGSYGVASKRQAVVDLFTSPKVIATIKRLNIELISYKELKNN